MLDAQVKLLTDCYWHIADSKEADASLWAEGPVGWSRETLPKDLTDGNASAAICIGLFIIYFFDKAKSWEEVESAVLRIVYVAFSQCDEYSIVREAGRKLCHLQTEVAYSGRHRVFYISGTDWGIPRGQKCGAVVVAGIIFPFLLFVYFFFLK